MYRTAWVMCQLILPKSYTCEIWVYLYILRTGDDDKLYQTRMWLCVRLLFRFCVLYCIGMYNVCMMALLNYFSVCLFLSLTTKYNAPESVYLRVDSASGRNTLNLLVDSDSLIKTIWGMCLAISFSSAGEIQHVWTWCIVYWPHAGIILLILL